MCTGYVTVGGSNEALTARETHRKTWSEIGKSFCADQQTDFGEKTELSVYGLLKAKEKQSK